MSDDFMMSVRSTIRDASKRPQEVTNLIRTVNPKTTHRDFVSATRPESIALVLRYIFALESQIAAFGQPNGRSPLSPKKKRSEVQHD